MLLTFTLENMNCRELLANYHKGLQDLHFNSSYFANLTLYGANSYTIPAKSVSTILVNEMLSPIYIFQVASIIIWYCENYYVYTSFILAASIFSVSLNLYDTLKSQSEIQKMSNLSVKVPVLRNLDPQVVTLKGDRLVVHSPIEPLMQVVDSEALVPGDLVLINSQALIPCDLILLNGSCQVDESVLTGESIPVFKKYLDL